MQKEFNEQAIQISALTAIASICYALSGSETVAQVVFTGALVGICLYLAMKVFYFILGVSLIVPVQLMVSYALIIDSDVAHAIADLLNRRYGYKGDIDLLVEDQSFETETVDNDFRQVVVESGGGYFLYDTNAEASIIIPEKFLGISAALAESIRNTESKRFSKSQISSANLGFDKRREEDSLLMDDFFEWLVKEDLAISGGTNRPYQLTEKGQEFY